MPAGLKFLWTVCCLSLLSFNAYPQRIDFDSLARIPGHTAEFPLDYKIKRPSLQYPDWDRDFDLYYAWLTPALKKTQASLSYTDKGVTTTMTPNSIIPHAQLDIATIVQDKETLPGTWRMLSYRSLRFNDSVDIPTRTYYRLADTLLADKSSDVAFLVLTEKHFDLYVRAEGKKSFKKEVASKYSIENRRFMMLYKVFKGGAGVSQFGMDEAGHLIINYPKVIENVRKEDYFSYYTIIDQIIFEKVQ